MYHVRLQWSTLREDDIVIAADTDSAKNLSLGDNRVSMRKIECTIRLLGVASEDIVEEEVVLRMVQ